MKSKRINGVMGKLNYLLYSSVNQLVSPIICCHSGLGQSLNVRYKPY